MASRSRYHALTSGSTGKFGRAVVIGVGDKHSARSTMLPAMRFNDVSVRDWQLRVDKVDAQQSPVVAEAA
jgi:hypothetical protein